MGRRSQRATIARQTLDILRAGRYVTGEGTEVHIGDMQEYAESHSVLYRPDMFAKVFTKRDEMHELLGTDQRTEFRVVDQRTLDAAARLVDIEKHGHIGCLNFSSAKRPGGGFLGGSEAQEESLARASGLYPCIAQMTDMYDTNKKHGSSLYTDHVVYSPGVPVFRSGTDELLEVPYKISIITAPAPNAGAVRDNEPGNIDRIESTLIGRTEMVLSVAAINNVRILILGAWGCGVFRNNPAMVARSFYTHLVERDTFGGLFETVVSAIWDNSRSRKIVTPFREMFGATHRNIH